MKNLLRDSLRAISHKLEQFAKILDNENRFKIVITEYTKSHRCLSFTFSNNKLKTDKNVFRAIFNTLMSNKEFKDFGENKIIITSGIYNNNEFNYHHNVNINNYTTFEEYYNEVKDIISTNYQDGYPVDVIPEFKVKVWNMDKYANRSIKMTRNTVVFGPKIQTRSYTSYIKPISITNIDPSLKNFAAMDVETINWKGKQEPIAVTTTYVSEDNKINTKIFLIEPKLFIRSPNFAINKLWNRVFEFIFNNPTNFEIIFTHNLGSFDGYFIYKALSNYFTDNPEIVSTIIDNQNKFITIKVNLDNNKNIKWLDSYRIFPLSLDDLCKMFKVEGKISKYDERFNSIDMFNDPKLLEEFKQYAVQDSSALFDALIKAQDLYFSMYSVDITSILSTSTLSLKIFRQMFLNVNIPILKESEEGFIRKGYFGGATDYYYAYCENAHYYDVNSLYPHAMKNLIPFKVIKFHKDLSNIKLENFFGFCLAKVTAPKDIEYPLLPYKHEGKTIFPIGSWSGIYFSEELKEVVKHGYIINLIEGFEFSKVDLFSEFVDHFYHIKRNSAKDSPERWISKLHLNTPYGTFGRRKDILQTFNIKRDDLHKYASVRVIKSILEVNDKICTILVHNNLDLKIIKKLNLFFNTEFNNTSSEVKSNVAIASAVTSYARIHMIKFKVLCIELGIKIIYTDTDSIFTDKPLPDYLIGVELGQFKDELNGLVIKQAYFLGIKNYGYTIEYPNKEIKEYSVWAGVKRNSISFIELIEISKGKTITKKMSDRFYKYMSTLNVTIKDSKTNISLNNNKILINNKFHPPLITQNNNILDITFLFERLKNKILKIFKKLCITKKLF